MTEEHLKLNPDALGDLYAALEIMLAVYWGKGDGYEPDPGCIIATKAALAKARGEQP